MKRVVALLMILVFMCPWQAFAESIEQNGFYVILNTDKENYVYGEEIVANISMYNTGSGKISDVTIHPYVSEPYILTDGQQSVIEVGALNTAISTELDVFFSINDAELPDTGDQFNPLLMLLCLMISGCTVYALYRFSNRHRWLSYILFICLLASSTLFTCSAYAEERSLNVEKNIWVSSQIVTLGVHVRYQYEMAEIVFPSNTPTAVPMWTPTPVPSEAPTATPIVTVPEVIPPATPTIKPAVTPSILAKGLIQNTEAGVNLRKGPGTTYESMGLLRNGVLVDILEMPVTIDTEHWFKVALGDNVFFIQEPYVKVLQMGEGDSATRPEDLPANPISEFRWKLRNDDSEVVITQYIGDDDTVIIPASVYGIPVVEVAEYAFDTEWKETDYLKNISIPASVTKLGMPLFSYCPNLESITVASNNPQYASVNGVLHSKDMKTLILCPPAKSGTFRVPDGVMTIGPSAFESCSKLDTVILPASLQKIENRAFSWCDNLASITIPENVHTIGDGAFIGCSSMKTVYIPSNVTSLGDMAFSYCDDLTSIQINMSNPKYTSVDGVLYTKDMHTLLSCPGGKTDTCIIPEGVKTIHNHAFDSCEKLTIVAFPESLQTIEAWAFSGCTGLKNVQIPGKQTVIQSSAFAYCNNLTEIQVAPDNQYHTSVDGALFTKDMKTLITCPGAKEGAYTIPDGVNEIEEYAFADCSGVTEINIPNSVTSIVSCAFDGCSKLQTISIPQSITELQSSLFMNCSGLTSITIPSSVVSIDDGTFWGAPLSSLTVYCEENSYAHTYCVAKNIQFKLAIVDDTEEQECTHIAIDKVYQLVNEQYHVCIVRCVACKKDVETREKESHVFNCQGICIICNMQVAASGKYPCRGITTQHSPIDKTYHLTKKYCMDCQTQFETYKAEHAYDKYGECACGAILN